MGSGKTASSSQRSWSFLVVGRQIATVLPPDTLVFIGGFTVARSLAGFWGLVFTKRGDALLLNTILQGGAFFFTGEDVTLQAEEAWVVGRQLRVLREVGHFWWLGDGRGA